MVSAVALPYWINHTLENDPLKEKPKLMGPNERHQNSSNLKKKRNYRQNFVFYKPKTKEKIS